LEEASFRTSDGVELTGTLIRPREGADGAPVVGVVLAHMYPTDQKSWWPFAMGLASMGYWALPFDFRGYGASEGEKEIAEIDLDVEAARDFLVQQGAREVFLIGASMGGTASVIVASRDSSLAGLVSLSAPESFMGLDASEAANRVEIPSFFIAAQSDDGAPQAADQMARAVAEPMGDPTPVYRLTVQGADHGTQLLEGVETARIEQAILSFLQAPDSTTTSGTRIVLGPSTGSPTR
jgi:pimeloyl-ACP methyl ester carboxylesterase